MQAVLKVEDADEFQVAVKQLYADRAQIAREVLSNNTPGNVLANMMFFEFLNGIISTQQEMMDHAEVTLAAARENSDGRGEAKALWTKSRLLHSFGLHAEAVTHAEEALTNFEQIKDPNTEKVRRQLAQWRGEQ